MLKLLWNTHEENRIIDLWCYFISENGEPYANVEDKEVVVINLVFSGYIKGGKTLLN
jgi:hypothetical protein